MLPLKKRAFRALAILFFALIAAASISAEEQKEPFDPKIYSHENLPQGIRYIKSGKVDLIFQDSIVVRDSAFSLTKATLFVYEDGEKASIHAVYKGKKVDVFVGQEYEAVYVVLK